MQNEDWDKILPLAECIMKLVELWIVRKYPAQQNVPENEKVWKKGDPLPEPRSIAEYRDLPEQPGRFERAIAQARRSGD
jgi:hypothetical protein